MAKPYQFKINLNQQYNKDQREAIAAEIISFMRQRTLSGKDVNGQSFKAYSTSYKNSVNFRAGGKSDRVNLKLSGDMLAYMELVKNSKGEIVVGYSDDNPQAGKAEGNQIGTYGQKKPISGKARPFIGISDDDLNKILKKYPIKNEVKLEKRTEAVLRAQDRIDKYVTTLEEEGQLDEQSPSDLKDAFKIKIGD